MLELMSNFTTPDQSERLLKLGVPADSSDCYYGGFPEGIQVKPSQFFKSSKPCWSVGRLIEIHTICGGASSSYYISAFPTNILNEVMWHLTEAVRHGWIDFSKLNR